MSSNILDTNGKQLLYLSFTLTTTGLFDICYLVLSVFCNFFLFFFCFLNICDVLHKSINIHLNKIYCHQLFKLINKNTKLYNKTLKRRANIKKLKNIQKSVKKNWKKYLNKWKLRKEVQGRNQPTQFLLFTSLIFFYMYVVMLNCWLVIVSVDKITWSQWKQNPTNVLK